MSPAEIANFKTMRKSNQEITDPGVIEEILAGSRICRLAMNDGGTPYLLPFNYGYAGGYIYIHSAREGRKIEVLKKDARVCFEIEQKTEILPADQPCGWSTLYRSVIGYGTVEMISDREAKEAALAIIMAGHGRSVQPDFGRKQLDSVLVLRLHIESITGKQSGNWDRLIERPPYDLESERLFLKEVTMDDLENIHRLHSSPEVDRYNTLGIPGNLDATRELLRSALEDRLNPVRKIIAWSIRTRPGLEFIGEAGIRLSADRFRMGEIYFSLDPVSWGKGYATETARRIIRFGFHDLRLHRIEAGVDTENASSIRVLEKAGMTREGIRRGILPIRGKWKDNYHYAILEGELID
ncbi:MAG: GNAT family N-acetyltransferase [Bacteroidetes bacterium]|nr:MAG: GNAT family N-acetyltransferase [Bacteroidota bacterium]